MKPADPLAAALADIESEFEVVLGDPETVAATCRTVRSRLGAPPDDELAAHCGRRLVPLLDKRRGPLAAVLFDLLADLARAMREPRQLVAALLEVHDASLRQRTLDLVLDLVDAGRLAAGLDLATDLARAIDGEAKSGLDAPRLARIAGLLGRVPSSEPLAGPDDPLEKLLVCGASAPLRRLAALVLDRDGALPSSELARHVLGDDAAGFLASHLDYTRATHRDLVDLVPTARTPPPGLASWRRAQEVLGKELLSSVVAELGWSRVVWGLRVRQFVGQSIDGGFPFVVSPAAAELLGTCGSARRLWERFLVVAHGAQPEDETASAANQAVQRFRGYNLCHAELLGEILEIGPLTVAKTRRILQRMDRIVADYGALFSEQSAEAQRLPAAYAALRDRIAAGLANADETAPLPAETTRLVQMFEDPRSLDEVRTLHGLKRYLHQQGLRHAFKAFRAAKTTNRTVDLVLASRDRVLHVARPIHYVDFEPEPNAAAGELPFPVALLVESLGSQLVHGQRTLPNVELFVYGNEVQVFVSFRNHPAFLRVDLSPPLRGGMLDLEYFGVSQYEMGQHPDPTLQGMRRLFRSLDFDVALEGFRLHVRYDKERAFDLGDIIARAGSLFRLLPYLMDVDWVIGGLDYPEPGREAVAAAWSQFFGRWGVLPLEAFLTSDRRAVLQARSADPTGEHEVRWSGRGLYQDVFSGRPALDLLSRLRGVLAARGLDRHARWAGAHRAHPSQLYLQQSVLEPLEEAVERGEVQIVGDRFTAAPPERFRREHEAERLARLLHAAGEPLGAAMRLAAFATCIERQLRFRTTGSVQGYPVQAALLPLRGETIGLFVLRDAQSIVTAAIAARNAVLFRHREDPAADWIPSPDLGVQELTHKLRRDNYPIDGYEPRNPHGEPDPAGVATRASIPNPLAPPPVIAGERVLPGIAASPGKATGFALFGTSNRAPEDFVGAVLVAPVIRPEATPWLRQAAAAVSTGGGMLSHVGLIALELRKPALIVDGRWEHDESGAQVLVYRRSEYQEDEQTIGPYRVTSRRDLVEVEETLREGDLVVVDADAAVLTVLGQDRDALALHRELRQLETAAGGLARVHDSAEILVLRGRALRAIHQLEKLLARIDRPALAGYAVGELLYGSSGSPHAAERDGRRRLVRRLFENPTCGAVALQVSRQRVGALVQRHDALLDEARRAIPHLDHIAEVLYQRLLVLGSARLLRELGALFADRGLWPASLAPRMQIDTLVRRRLEERRGAIRSAMARAAERPEEHWRLRHELRQAAELDRLLGTDSPPRAGDRSAEIRQQFEAAERAAAERLRERRIVGPQDGGFELAHSAGAKAGNLAEIHRILGPKRVPAWFAVTDAVFRRTLEMPVAGSAVEALDLGPRGRGNLDAAIREVLGRRDLEVGRRAAAVRQLWESAELPPELVPELLAAYRSLAAGPEEPLPGGPLPRVAIRSSAFEEDTDRAAWAGQFDTFLFISGEAALLHHLKLAWAGLWTGRAIHQRETLGTPSQSAGGGVVVQRMVDARVSGVLQTACVASGQLREMVVNVGLGLGEGVVSGIVAVDQVLVSKEGDLEHDPLRCRYHVGDKRERVVLDERSGFGTRVEETLYHQRLRAALEYVELRELVQTAARLERAYGQPLDIEFAYEGPDLRILQARPVVVFHAAIHDTLTQYPLRVPSSTRK